MFCNVQTETLYLRSLTPNLKKVGKIFKFGHRTNFKHIFGKMLIFNKMLEKSERRKWPTFGIWVYTYSLIFFTITVVRAFFFKKTCKIYRLRKCNFSKKPINNYKIIAKKKQTNKCMIKNGNFAVFPVWSYIVIVVIMW